MRVPRQKPIRGPRSSKNFKNELTVKPGKGKPVTNKDLKNIGKKPSVGKRKLLPTPRI
jgi:hypothetical protein